MDREPYPSDLSNEQWVLIEPMITAWKQGRVTRSATGDPGACDLREVVNAIFYQHRTDCQWRCGRSEHLRVEAVTISAAAPAAANKAPPPKPASTRSPRPSRSGWPPANFPDGPPSTPAPSKHALASHTGSEPRPLQGASRSGT